MRLELAALAALAVVASAPAAAAGWQVDPTRSSLAVEFQQSGKPVAARFDGFAAEIAFDPRDLAASSVVVVVDLASLRTGDAQRDQMAVSAELLAASSGPTARYASRRFTARDGDHYQVDAELTLKGVTLPLSHAATIAIKGDEAHAQGEVVLTRTDFDVGSTQFPRGDQIGLGVTVRFDLLAHRRG